MNGQADVEVDYKRKYKNLKRKLKFLVYVSVFILNRPVSSAVLKLRVCLCADFVSLVSFSRSRSVFRRS